MSLNKEDDKIYRVAMIRNRKFTAYILLVLVFALALFLRFINLQSVPSGLSQDETAIGYNAYSILVSGRDEYGKQMPLYFKSFGDHKLPVYIYLASASEKMFGVNPLGVRFPSAFFGSLTVLILFFLVKKVTGNISLALFSSFLLSITPWHIHFSRAAFEVNVALFFALAGTLLMILGKEKAKWQALLLVISVVSFGLSLYSYNVTRLLSPLLAISVAIIYRRDFIKLSRYLVVVLAVLAFVIFLPFVSTFFSNGGISSAGGALIAGNETQAKLLEFRSYFIDNVMISKLLLNKWIGMTWVYFENLGSILSGDFFFVKGSAHGNQGIGTAGCFYLFQLPLFLLGLISLLKNGCGKMKLFVWWGIVSLLVLGFSMEVPHATRGYFLVVPVTILSASGFLYGIELLKSVSKNIRVIIFTFFVLFTMLNLFHYFASYYVRFPIYYAKEWRQQDEALVSYLMQNEYKYIKIIFDSKADFIYTSYLFYSKYSPQNFYGSAKRFSDVEGFSRVQAFGKFEFRDVDWEKDNKKGTLIITTIDNGFKNASSLNVFYYPKRPVVLSVKNQLAMYPVTDVAYVLIEGDK
jgi:4-amino-4-deoxy-L-arabinose transferase-like glycosyltransferase